MRSAMVSAMSATLLLFLAYSPECRAQPSLPRGTYGQTCQNIRMNGNTLLADCQKVDGGWRRTSLDYQSCRGGEVINDNGYLRCGGEGGWRGGENRGGQGGLPPGDYKRTCQNMNMQGDSLNASCQKVDGGWNDTSLRNVSRCRTRIVNDNGNLRCEK